MGYSEKPSRIDGNTKYYQAHYILSWLLYILSFLVEHFFELVNRWKIDVLSPRIRQKSFYLRVGELFMNSCSCLYWNKIKHSRFVSQPVQPFASQAMDWQNSPIVSRNGANQCSLNWGSSFHTLWVPNTCSHDILNAHNYKSRHLWLNASRLLDALNCFLV